MLDDTDFTVCSVCKSQGFAPSIQGDGCTFCDGTESGNPPAGQLFFGGPLDGECLVPGGYTTSKTLVVEWPQNGTPENEELYLLYKPQGEHAGEAWRLHIESRPALRLRVKQR